MTLPMTATPEIVLDHRPAPAASSTARGSVFRYVVAVSVVTLILAGFAVFMEPSPRVSSMIVWTLAAIVAQLMVFPTTTKAGEISLGMSVHLAMILLLKPAEFIPALCISRIIAHFFFRRTVWYKAVFNTAQIALSVLTGYVVFRSLYGGAAFHPGAGIALWAPAYLAGTLAYYLVNMALVSRVIAISTDRPSWTVWRENYGYPAEIIATAGLVLLSPIIAMTSVVLGSAGLLAFLVPMVFLRDASTRYIALRRAQQALVDSERLAAKGELATDVGHAIIEHLTALQGNLQLMMMKSADIPPEMRGRLASAMDKLEDISALSRSLIDFACGDVHPIPTRLNNVVRTSVDFLRGQKRLEGVELQMELDSRIGQVSVDPAQIQQVVSALVVNSAAVVKAASSGRRIVRVYVRFRDMEHVEMGVADSGPLVTAGHVFEPDFTSGQARQGFALSIAYRIVKNHSGTISVEPSDLGGTLYRIVLPAVPAEPARLAPKRFGRL